MKNNKSNTCCVCGRAYQMCLSCKSFSLTPWKLHTDTSEHYKVFQILRGFNLGVYTKEEARERLASVDMSDRETYLQRIKDQLDSIETDTTEKKQNPRSRKKQNTETTQEPEMIADDRHENTDDEMTVEKQDSDTMRPVEFMES